MTTFSTLGKRRRRLRVTWTLLGTGLAAALFIGAWQLLASREKVHRPGEEMEDVTSSLTLELPGEAPEPRFTDVTGEAGISFTAFAGPRTSQLPEDMGSGAAWGDFDDDGDEDLFLVSNGGALDLETNDRAASELYENLGHGKFRKVESLPEVRIIGEKVAAGIRRRAEFTPYRLDGPIRVEVGFKNYRPVELLGYLSGVDRLDSHTIGFTGRDMLEVSRFLEFITSYSPSLTP